MRKYKILLVLHELSYSGAPFSTKRMAMALLDGGFEVEVWSYKEGDFAQEFQGMGVQVTIVPPEKFKEKKVKKRVQTFSLIIAQTVLTYHVVNAFQYIVPTIWYIREAKNLPWQYFKYDVYRYFSILRAKNIYTVSEYAQEFIANNYNSNVKVVHNCVEDEARLVNNHQYSSNRIKILMLGSIEQRKAFDVLLKSYHMLADNYKKKCEIHIAGRQPDYAKQYANDVLAIVNNTDLAFYHGEIKERKKTLQLIYDSDVVAVISKDESCSLVALEAAMMSKPIIISENVGAKYIVTPNNGWIIKKDDVNQLKSIIEKIVDQQENLHQMGLESRKMYEKFASYENYKYDILQMVKSNMVAYKRLYVLNNFYRRLCDRVYWHKKGKKKKNYYFKNIDGYTQKVIVVYGAGAVGQEFYAQYGKTGKIDIKCYLDANPKKQKIDEIPIYTPENIINISYDLVYVAVMEKNIFEEILEKLLQYGVPKEKIIWSDPYKVRY